MGQVTPWEVVEPRFQPGLSRSRVRTTIQPPEVCVLSACGSASSQELLDKRAKSNEGTVRKGLRKASVTPFPFCIRPAPFCMHHWDLLVYNSIIIQCYSLDTKRWSKKLRLKFWPSLGNGDASGLLGHEFISQLVDTFVLTFLKRKWFLEVCSFS